MRRMIILCAALLALATPSWAESAAPAHDHAPAPSTSTADPATPPPAPKQAQPDMMQLMMEAGETLHADHGDDHSNCCKIKKPAQ